MFFMDFANMHIFAQTNNNLQKNTIIQFYVINQLL